MSKMNAWMSWEGGVDLVGSTQEGIPMPNVIVHVARQVHTPLGSAPAGIILYQPDLGGSPKVLGFVSSDPKVGAYFGPNIFAGTPFEEAPVLEAKIEIELLEGEARSRVEVGGLVFETVLTGIGETGLISREPSGMSPFHQQGLECVATGASLKVDGEEVPLVLPEVSITGGPPAVFAPSGVYAR